MVENIVIRTRRQKIELNEYYVALCKNYHYFVQGLAVAKSRDLGLVMFNNDSD